MYHILNTCKQINVLKTERHREAKNHHPLAYMITIKKREDVVNTLLLLKRVNINIFSAPITFKELIPELILNFRKD
jgi:hypothetical protein